MSFTEPRSENLTKFINYTVILLSVLAQFQEVYKYLAFSGEAIVGSSNSHETVPDSEADPGEVFAFWTIITCVFFEVNWFFLGLHLLIINYVVRQLEHIWSRRSFAALVVFSAFFTGIMRLGWLVIYANTIESETVAASAKGIMTEPYCSINHLVIMVLMGCRQVFPDRNLNTGIPFLTDNIMLPFKQLPALYVFMCWLCAFIFEMSIDFSLLGTLYFSWIYLRFFMVTKQTAPNQIGDTSANFSLTSFFPERAH